MKLGILWIVLGVFMFGAIIALVNFGGAVTMSFVGIGKLVVAGLVGLWFLGDGTRRIRIAKLKALLEGGEDKENQLEGPQNIK